MSPIFQSALPNRLRRVEIEPTATDADEAAGAAEGVYASLFAARAFIIMPRT